MPRVKKDGTRNRNKLPLPSNIPEGTRAVTVCIPDGDDYYMYLIGAMYRLGQQIWYDRDQAKTAQHVAEAWRLALSQTLAGQCATNEEPPPITKDDIIAGGYANSMCNHITQMYNGLWYFGIDCGCGNIQWIPIGHAVQLDPTTNAPVPPSQDSVNITTPKQSNAACYAEVSVDYLLNRFRQWLNTASGVTTFVLDEVFNRQDDVVDMAATSLQLTDGSSVMSEIANAAEGVIYNSVIQYRAQLVAAWNLSGRITMAQLLEFFMAVIPKWTLEGQAVIAWLSNTLLLGISADLAKIAADCEGRNGNSTLAPLLPSPYPTGTWLGPVSEPNDQLEKFTYFFNETLTANEQTIQTAVNDNAAQIVAIAIYGTATSSSTENFWRIGNSTTQIFRARITDQSATVPLRMFTYDPYDVNTIEPTTPTRTDSLNSTAPAPIFITTEVWDNTTAEVFIEKIEVWKLKE